jgi:predicted transcriptional regulator
MNIDEVLLTSEEIKVLLYKTYATSIDCDKAITKAAQLKLLEWGNKRCKEHCKISKEISRFNCPICMYELESKLKEG